MARPPVLLAALALLPVSGVAADAGDTADFAVLEAWVEPPDPAEGQGVTFHAVVANFGAGASTWIGFIVDEEEGAPAPYVVLGEGDVREVRSTWTATGVGARTVRAVADPSLLVTEPDEANNEREAGFHVRAPDPAVAAVSVVPPPLLEPWAPPRVEVLLANLGTAGTRLEYRVHIVACPAAMPFEAFATCEEVGVVTVPPSHPVGDDRSLRVDWDTVGDLGAFTLCAALSYPAPQLTEANDARCAEASAWAPLPRGLRLL